MEVRLSVSADQVVVEAVLLEQRQAMAAQVASPVAALVAAAQAIARQAEQQAQAEQAEAAL